MALSSSRSSSGLGGGLGAQKKGGGAKKLLAVVVVVALAAGGFFLQRELRLPPPAVVELSASRPAIGPETALSIKASEPIKGIAHLVVTADGCGLSKKVLLDLPAPDAAPSPDGVLGALEATALVGKKHQPELVPGTLTIEVTATARGTRLRTPEPVVVTKTFEVKLDPPSLSAASSFIHPAQGGAEVVVYDVGPSSVRDGVQAGDWFFAGAPLPGGGPSQRFVLFAVPYDWDGVSEDEGKARLKLVAEDAVGNRSETTFAHKYFPRPMGKDVIALKDSFMQKVTGEIYSHTPELQKKGNLLDDYLQLNGELRKKNMAELKELSQKSQQKFLWSTTFAPMQNAAVKGSFADRRTYKACPADDQKDCKGGKDVDTQDHLGFDLASLERAPVQAGNSGVVVLARYFGIFGNCVVIDHGYGLMTLYAHLSTIAVKEGDAVEKGKEIGKTGATGLAGGDHLHFTTLIGGLPVTPIEWWDGHWIHDRLKLKLQDALPWKE